MVRVVQQAKTAPKHLQNTPKTLQSTPAEECSELISDSKQESVKEQMIMKKKVI